MFGFNASSVKMSEQDETRGGHIWVCIYLRFSPVLPRRIRIQNCGRLDRRNMMFQLRQEHCEASANSEMSVVRLALSVLPAHDTCLSGTMKERLANSRM